MLRACCAHNWINLQMRLARLVSKANQKSVSDKNPLQQTVLSCPSYNFCHAYKTAVVPWLSSTIV